ncbi:FIST signal transduction protein [Sulfurovum sp. ST-21]|uniref:FIST C-terminal domain-containing protein n=1 Tax=Sulfurovum indicum TaxID=2779528 RepID=A0A7M1S3M9_9BACT|nr:FIST N-terminal domain-containing protein [Sulfurovum indicum]QOR61958.1 FIST C-terminal domain-containing protein [Sulfurovum indicum]
MHTETLKFINGNWKIKTEGPSLSKDADIVFTFGEREEFKDPESYSKLRSLYPNAHIIGCSSSGNVLNDSVSDAPMVATAVSFDSGSVKISVEDFSDKDDLKELSHRIVSKLPKEGLKHIFILSDGLSMNGSFLAEGANEAADNNISITGGLAGDGTAFEETWVIADEAAKQNRVVAVGFYGETVSVESGCFAGWDEFGILRKITRSKNNIVYEIDGLPALELYKKYLGEYADELPGSGLRFPFSIKKDADSNPVIRTILAVDEETQSLVFAGDVPEGYLARLMKTDTDGLIDGAESAAKRIDKTNTKSALGLVISCVGRRLVLKQLTDEELESIADTLGENVQLVGFYSYGELAPFSDKLMSCQLHNQTMTLTVIYEG